MKHYKGINDRYAWNMKSKYVTKTNLINMEQPLTPNEVTTIGEIITYILTFIGGWVMRILQSKNPNKNGNNR